MARKGTGKEAKLSYSGNLVRFDYVPANFPVRVRTDQNAFPNDFFHLA